jgi:hypothetical protein
VDTFSDLSSGNVLAFSFVHEEIVEDTLELVDESQFVEVLFEFIDAHDRHSSHFLVMGREASAILMIFAVVHAVEGRIELCELLSDMVEAEDEDLVLSPDLIEVDHEAVGIFSEFFEGSELGLDVALDEVLDIFPHEAIDVNPILGSGLVLCKLEDQSMLNKRYSRMTE